MNKNIYWKGFCSKDRNVAIYEIENIVNKYGFITDFRMSSDIEIGIKIEIEEQYICNLYDDLQNYLSIDGYEDLNLQSKKERLIFFNITFLKGTGNLKIEVPAVPG